MNKLAILGVALALTACTTPKVVMMNPKTGQVVSCGGSATGSMVGGIIGYNIQKSNDAACVADYAEFGFKRVRNGEE